MREGLENKNTATACFKLISACWFTLVISLVVHSFDLAAFLSQTGNLKRQLNCR